MTQVLQELLLLLALARIVADSSLNVRQYGYWVSYRPDYLRGRSFLGSWSHQSPYCLRGSSQRRVESACLWL